MESDERPEGEQPTGQKSREPHGVSEQNVETRVAPRICVPATAPDTDRNPASPTRHNVPTDSTEGLFRIIAEQREVAVPATGEPAVLSLRIMNTSAIVDSYDVEAASAPRWLQVESIQIRLLPGSEEAPAIRMRVASPSPVPAQRVQVMLGIRSIRQATAHAVVPVVITVPVLEVPIRLQAEPAVLRVRDRDGATFTVVVDNSSSNGPVQLRFAGWDPELAVGFRFEPPVLEVGPAASASVVVTVTAARPGPGQQISRALTVSALDGSRRVDTVITFVQAASASPMSTLGVRIEPSIVRLQDADGTTLQVILDNRRGHSGIRLFLDGSDPERATRATFSPAIVDLGPGQVRAVSLRLDSWRPPPGQEWTRQFTVTASDGYSSAEALGSLLQSSSRAAIETLAVRLDPSVLRLSGRRGGLRALIDNRNGTQPIRVTMRGDDPENIVRFTFAPGILDIPPGQVASSSVTLTTSWAPAGDEVTRPFVILASDGRFEVQADGSIIQSSAERRPLARLLLTLFGALAMILGALLPWWRSAINVALT